MAQQPNIELRGSDLPRREPEAGPPMRWKPSRPGDLAGPEDQPWGGAFGTPGPDPGWAHMLIDARPIEFPPDENSETTRALLAALVNGRASLLGRAPIPEDVDVALLALGLEPDQLPASLMEPLGESRRFWAGQAAREKIKGASLVAALGPEVLVLTPTELRHRLVVESHAAHD